MMQQTQHIRIKNHVLDIVTLPEAAQEELITFYDFLVYKYHHQASTEASQKPRILSAIFDEAHGILPDPYIFDREALHER